MAKVPGVIENAGGIMTKDELKKKLRSAFVIQKQIEAEYIELQNLRDNANRITPTYSVAPSSSGGNGQKLENAMAKILDAEKTIRSELEILMVERDEIRKLISFVDDPILTLILHKRYLCYQKWEVIAVDLDYDLRWIHRLHARALNCILKNTPC